MITKSPIVPVKNYPVSYVKKDPVVAKTDSIIDIDAEVISIDASIEDCFECITEPDFIEDINYQLAEVLSAETTERQDRTSVCNSILDLLNSTELVGQC